MKTLKTIIAITVLSLFSFSCSSDDDSKDAIKEELNYSNGNLSTVSVSSFDKTTAPSGYTWSEMQAGNNILGFGANDALALADDFVVPAGEKWNVEKISFYIYKNGHNGEDSPVKDIRYEIYSSNPSQSGAVKKYGDIAVNKYAASADSKMYRISNTANSSTTTRKIFKITASAKDLELPSGTYWIKWQTKAVDDVSTHYHPSNTIVGSPGLTTYNAIQQKDGVWKELENGSGIKADLPFEIVGTKTKI